MIPKLSRFSPNCSRPLTVGATLLASMILQAADPVVVSVVRPIRGEITRHVVLPGTLRANQQVTVQARVAGFVKVVSVDRGDRVVAGQTLAEIEVPELLAERTRQRAELKVAEADARRLEAGRQRSPDLVTPQALDAAIGRFEVAKAELDKTETLLRYANITAPFAGTITARFVDPGAFVPAGAVGGASRLMTLADTGLLRAQVPVPESEAVFIKVGQPARVTVEGLTNVYPATVSRHSGALDDTTRSLLVEADLANPSGELRPGMFATVRLGLERRAGALLVPTETIAMEKTMAFILRVDNGVSRKTAVRLGFQDGAMTEVLSGLTEDARVISPAKSAPADGVAVQVKESK